MSDPDTEFRRGEDARRILEEPLLVEAFSTVEDAILARLKVIDVSARDAQRDLIVMLQLLGKLKQHLEQVMVTGRMVQLEQERNGWVQKLMRRA
jgi:hypothetical protein